MHDTEAAAAMRAHLVETIVKPDVIARMESVNWDSGLANSLGAAGTTPAPEGAPNPTSQSAPAPAAPVANPQQASPTATTVQLNFDEFKEANGLYAGKYNSPEELIKGMRNLVSGWRTTQKELDELRAGSALPTTVAPGQTGAEPSSLAPAYDAASPLDTVLKQIVERDNGVLDESNSTLLRDAIIKLTEGKAQGVADAQAREAQIWDNVTEKMEQRYPGSSLKTDDLHIFVKTNPDVQTAVAALIAKDKHFEATDFAYRLMTNSSPLATPALTPAQVTEEQLLARDKVRMEAVDAARKDAGVLTTTGSGVHEAPVSVPVQEEIDAAAHYGNATGDWASWRRIALGPHMHFDSPLFKR